MAVQVGPAAPNESSSRPNNRRRPDGGVSVCDGGGPATVGGMRVAVDESKGVCAMDEKTLRELLDDVCTVEPDLATRMVANAYAVIGSHITLKWLEERRVREGGPDGDITGGDIAAGIRALRDR